MPSMQIKKAVYDKRLTSFDEEISVIKFDRQAAAPKYKIYMSCFFIFSFDFLV